MLRLCATEETLYPFVRPKEDMLQLCATQNSYVVSLCDPKKYFAAIATQNRYVATLCDRNDCATLRDPKQIGCDIVRPKKGMLRPLRLKMGMLRLCATKTYMLDFPGRGLRFMFRPTRPIKDMF